MIQILLCIILFLVTFVLTVAAVICLAFIMAVLRCFIVNRKKRQKDE